MNLRNFCALQANASHQALLPKVPSPIAVLPAHDKASLHHAWKNEDRPGRFSDTPRRRRCSIKLIQGPTSLAPHLCSARSVKIRCPYQKDGSRKRQQPNESCIVGACHQAKIGIPIPRPVLDFGRTKVRLSNHGATVRKFSPDDFRSATARLRRRPIRCRRETLRLALA